MTAALCESSHDVARDDASDRDDLAPPPGDEYEWLVCSRETARRRIAPWRASRWVRLCEGPLGLHVWGLGAVSHRRPCLRH